MLDLETFKTVVHSAPLVSIDLLVRNAAGQVLLGMRNNRPAQGFWFVPGGRIRKDETLEQAFSRLMENELGISVSIQEACFTGPWQHFYQDNFSGEDFTTHYLVLGYQLVRDVDITALPNEQHNQYRWYTPDELLASEEVHQHTKDYFDKDWGLQG